MILALDGSKSKDTHDAGTGDRDAGMLGNPGALGRGMQEARSKNHPFPRPRHIPDIPMLPVWSLRLRESEVGGACRAHA